MLLVQKPLTLTPSQSPLYAHRRHPSAPSTVVVHSTRTPGLLTLSKPPRPPLQRQSQRQTPKRLPNSKSAPGIRATLLNSAEITDSKTSVIALPTTPSPQPRGRGQIKHPKDKVQVQRSPSQPSGRGKCGRQPSPPIPQPQSYLFDPFIDNDSSPSSDPSSSPSQPSGRGKCGRQPSPPIPQPQSYLFDHFLDNDSSPSCNPSSRISPNHRQPHTASSSPSPLHSEAIHVPAATRRQTSNVSRSEPPLSPIRQRSRPISVLPSTLQHFPICDDMNDSAGIPTTPQAARRQSDIGLQTSPISARTPGAFPLNADGLHSPPSPVASKRGNRKHRRAPSDGVFHMSSDEDLSSGPGGTLLNPNVQALFGLVNTFNPISRVPSSLFSTPIRSIPPYRRDFASPSNGSLSKEKLLAAEKAAGYFASSMFQNSPSPEELPDPLLV